MSDTPILLITFNRPSHTRKVWTEIKKHKPKQVFIFQDGVRKKNVYDKEICAAVRDIFKEQSDWEYELNTYYSDENLGCGRGPATAISWFFEHVDQGIIFEDDCLPHNDFFNYCSELLKQYKDNKRISFIGGSNFQRGIIRGNGSYYYSAGHHGTWGWATWKRTWDNFDYNLSNISEDQIKPIIRKYFKTRIQRKYWQEIYRIVKKNRLHDTCWDYQFYFACWKQNSLAIIPNHNLVSNIGFDEEATHTTTVNNKLANISVYPILPLKTPSNIKQNIKADLFLHKYYIQPNRFGIQRIKRIPFQLSKKIKQLIGKEGNWLK